jgi:hypothetical protein
MKSICEKRIFSFVGFDLKDVKNGALYVELRIKNEQI